MIFNLKNIVLAMFSLVLLGGQMQAQTAQKSLEIFDFYEQHAEEDGFTTVYISSKMFELFANIEIEDDEEAEEIIDIVQELKGIRILVYDAEQEEEDENGNTLTIRNDKYNPQALYNEVYSKLPKNHYEDLMVVKSDGTDVKFMVRESSRGVIEELLMLVGEEDTFVFMSIVGTIDLKKISRLANSVEVEGLDHLKTLDESTVDGDGQSNQDD